jgi:hypothetical protein
VAFPTDGFTKRTVGLMTSARNVSGGDEAANWMIIVDFNEIDPFDNAGLSGGSANGDLPESILEDIETSMLVAMQVYAPPPDFTYVQTRNWVGNKTEEL